MKEYFVTSRIDFENDFCCFTARSIRLCYWILFEKLNHKKSFYSFRGDMNVGM